MQLSASQRSAVIRYPIPNPIDASGLSAVTFLCAFLFSPNLLSVVVERSKYVFVNCSEFVLHVVVFLAICAARPELDLLTTPIPSEEIF